MNVRESGRKQETDSSQNKKIIDRRQRRCWRCVCSVIYIGIYIEHILTERFGHETDQRDGRRGETTMAFLGDWRTYIEDS